MAITYVKDIPDFNKKVKDLTDITDVKDDIEDIQEDITDIQGDITEIQDDVTEAQGDITTLAGAVTALDGEVDTISTVATFGVTGQTSETVSSIFASGRAINKNIEIDITLSTTEIAAGGTATCTLTIPDSYKPVNYVPDTFTFLGFVPIGLRYIASTNSIAIRNCTMDQPVTLSGVAFALRYML